MKWHSVQFSSWTSLVAQTVKRLCTMQETWVWYLGQEDTLEKEMAIHSSTIFWKIPWTEEPGRRQSMGSQRVRHNWATELNWTERQFVSLISSYICFVQSFVSKSIYFIPLNSRRLKKKIYYEAYTHNKAIWCEFPYHLLDTVTFLHYPSYHPSCLPFPSDLENECLSFPMLTFATWQVHSNVHINSHCIAFLLFTFSFKTLIQ